MEAQAVIAESHGQIGQVERMIGNRKRKMLAHLKSSDGSPEVLQHGPWLELSTLCPMCVATALANGSLAATSPTPCDSLMDMIVPTGLEWLHQRRCSTGLEWLHQRKCSTNCSADKKQKSITVSSSCERRPTWPTTPR